MQIRAEHLNKTVPLSGGSQLNILQDISLKIDSGEILGILGVSGSGKSTLLGILAGLDLPSDGSVFWDKIDITQLSEDGRANARLKKAGFVFQNFELLPAYTALENVLLPLELSGAKNAEEEAKNCLREVGLKARFFHYPNQLSGGEQQRVAIARAFAVRPQVLFADEPTGNLDQKTGTDIIKLLLELNRVYQTTTICVTHDAALSQICTRTLHISGGRLMETT